MLLSWNQKRGRIAVSGNVKVCRLWDVHAEKSIQEIHVGAKNCSVTKLSIDKSGNELLALGIIFIFTHPTDLFFGNMGDSKKLILSVHEEKKAKSYISRYAIKKICSEWNFCFSQSHFSMPGC